MRINVNALRQQRWRCERVYTSLINYAGIIGCVSAGYNADIVDACIAHPDENLTPSKRKVRKSYQGER